MPPVTDPNLLVGVATRDDAAVYRIQEDVALIQTLDFFPPMLTTVTGTVRLLLRTPSVMSTRWEVDLS